MNNRIAIVYLSYVPYGITHIEVFLKSYKKHFPHYDHTLLILFKGMNDESEVQSFIKVIAAAEIEYCTLYYKKPGFDIDAYFWVASQIDMPILLFFNSQSEILSNNWLNNYIDNLTAEIGVIAATASWQSHYSAVFQKNKLLWEPKKSFIYNFRKYKLFIKAFFYWRFLFKPFPNPHVRTNSFMIKRELFLQLKRKPLSTKFKAYQFESGRNSMTNQVLKLGYKVLVIDNKGQTYEPMDWKKSNTFWYNEQYGLLIEDNQTNLYKNSTPEDKLLLTKLAWGE